jgi:hypothetical protein
MLTWNKTAFSRFKCTKKGTMKNTTNYNAKRNINPEIRTPQF